MSPGDDVVLVLGGVLAGAVGTAGGISSLVSYPALLLVGLSPLAAAMTNVVALVPCFPGSALASRPELASRAAWIARWAAAAAAGGVFGSALLVSTPSKSFNVVVPYLLVLAVVSLLVQPWVSSRPRGARLRDNRLALGSGLFAACAYNGYFGAGSGVLVLALLLLTLDDRIAVANAVKNMLIGVATVVSAVFLAVLGHVRWEAALPLAVGAFGGSLAGPLVARHVPGSVLRLLVALMGLAMAARLWVAPV